MTPKISGFFPNVRVTALATVVFFLVTTTGWAAPAIRLSADPRAEFPAQSLADLIEIPSSLGQVTTRYVPRNVPASDRPESSPVTVIHIQDPHGQYEAQKNIRAILEHLENTYQVQTLFLEGGSGRLEDANLKVFKDPGLNREMVDILAREGFAGGPEMFLAERENGKTARTFSAYGVEDATLYLKNLETFRHVANHGGPTEKFFGRIRVRIKSLASRKFNPELKRYFQTWVFCEERPQEWLNRWEILKDYAVRHLALDLEDPYQQMDWPQAVRFTKLFGLSGSLKQQKNADALPVEWSALKTWLESKGLRDLAAQTKSCLEGKKPQLEFRSVREFFERFYAEASSRGFDFKTYPNLKMKMGERILTDEIHAPDLIAEVERIHERILKKLVATDLERDMIRLSREARLSEKLLGLQLVRADFREIQTAASSIAPGVIASRLDQLENRSLDSELPDLDAVYGEALRFYEEVAERDEVMFEKMMETIRQQKISRAVLVTGGFHAEGIEKGLKEKGISFVTVAPKMSEIQDSKTYLDALSGTVDYLTPRSYLRPATPGTPAGVELFVNCAPGFHLATQTVSYGQPEKVRDEARRSLARMELRYVPLARDGEEALFYRGKPVSAGEGNKILGLKNERLALFPSAQVRSESRNVPVDLFDEDTRGANGSGDAKGRSEMRAPEPTTLEGIKAQVVQRLGAGESLEEIIRSLMPVVSKNPGLASGIPDAVRGYYESLSQSFDEAEGGVENGVESQTKLLELPDLPQIHDLFRAAKNLHDRAKAKTRLMPTADNAKAIGIYFLRISAFGNSELAPLAREIYPEMTFFGDFSQLSKVSKLMMAQKHDLNREFQQAIAQSGASVLRQAREFLVSYGAHFPDKVNVEEVREVLEQTDREATQKEIAKQQRGKTVADPGKKNPEVPNITGFSAENLAMGRLIAQCVTPQDFALVAGFKRVPSKVRDAVIRLTLEGDIEQAKRILAGEESPVKEPSEIPVEVTQEKEVIDRPESVQETLPMPEPEAPPVKLTELDSQEIKVLPVAAEEPSQGTPEFSERLEQMSKDYLLTSLADLGGWTAEELADHLYSKGLADPGSLAKIQTLFSQRQSELSASGVRSDLNIQKVLEAVEFLQRENKEVPSKLKAAFDGMAKLFFEKSGQKSFMSYEKRIQRAALISNATLDFAFEGPEASQTFLQKVQQLGVYLVQSLMADQSIGSDEQSFYRKAQSLGRMIQYRLDSQKGNRDDLVLSLASDPVKMDEAKTVIETLGLPALGGDVPEWFRVFYEDARALGSPGEGARSEVRLSEVKRLILLLESARDLANDDIDRYVVESDELLGKLSRDLFEKLTKTRSRGLLDAISIRLEATNLSTPYLKKLRLWNMIAKADARKIKSPYLVERADSLARQIQSYRPSRETRSEVRSQPKTVLIVEPYETLRQGYEILVGSQFPESKIFRAKNTEEALVILRDQAADIDAILTGPGLSESSALDLTRETLDEARTRFRGSVVSVIRDAVAKTGLLIPMVVIVNHSGVAQDTGLQLLEDPPALMVSNSLDSIEQGLIYVMEMPRSELRDEDDETEEASPPTQMGYFKAPAKGVVASSGDLIQKMNIQVPAFTLNYDQSSGRFEVAVNQRRVNWNGKVAYDGYYNPFYDVTIAADGEQGNALLEEVRRGIDRALNEGQRELGVQDLEAWSPTVAPERIDFLGKSDTSEASDLKSPEAMRKHKVRLTDGEKQRISFLINEGYSPALADLGTLPGQAERLSLKWWLLGDEALSDFVQHAKHLMYEKENYSLREYIRGYFRDVLTFHEAPTPELRKKLIERYKRFALSELLKKHPYSKLALLHGSPASSWRVVVEGQDGDAEEDSVVMEPVVYQFKRGRVVRDDANYREKSLPGEQIVFARWKGQRFLFYTSMTHGIQHGPIRAWKMGNCYVPYLVWMAKETPENLAELPVGLSRALDDALAMNPEIVRADESAFADRANELGFSNFFDYPLLEEIQQLKYLARIDTFVKTLSDFTGRNFQIREALERVREKWWDLEMIRSHEISYARGEKSGYIPHTWLGEIRIGGETELRIVRDSQWVYSLQQEREGEWQRIPGAEFSFNENDLAEQVVMVGRGQQVNIPGLSPETRIVNPLQNDRTVSRAHVLIRARPGVDGDALFQFQRFSEKGDVFISVFDSEIEKYNRWILWEKWKEFSNRHGFLSGARTITCLVDRLGFVQEKFWTVDTVVPKDWEPLISDSGWKVVHFKFQNLKFGQWRLPAFQWGTRKFFEPLRVLEPDQDPKGLGRDLRDLETIKAPVAKVNAMLSRSENRVQGIPAEIGIPNPPVLPSAKETAQKPATDPDLVRMTPSVYEPGMQPRFRADARVNPASAFNDLPLPPEIAQQLKKLGYPFPSPLPLIEVAFAAGTTLSLAYNTSDRKISEFLLGLMVDKAVSLKKTLAPKEIERLESQNQNAFSAMGKPGETLPSGGTIFMDEKGLLDFAKYDSQGFFEFLSVLSASMTEGNRSRPLVTEGDQKLFKDLEMILKNKNADLTVHQQGEVRSLMAQVLEVVPAGDDPGEVIRQRADRMGWVAILSNENLLAGLPEGANFAFKNGLDKDNARLIMRSLLSRMRTLASLLHKAPLESRATLLEQFEQRQLGGTRKAAGGYVFDNILALAESLMTSMQAVARSA